MVEWLRIIHCMSSHFAPSEVIPDSKLTDPSKFCDVEGNPNDVGPHDTVLPIFCRHVQIVFRTTKSNSRRNCFCVKDFDPKRIDLLELCAPWDSPLAAAVERQGGTVLRLGLHNGYDMSTRRGLLGALAVVRRVRPRYVHMSPPCFPFSVMQNANQRTPEQIEALERKKNG